MQISGIISALHQMLMAHGDVLVYPKGDGHSAAHSVHFEDGHVVISDSMFDGLTHMFDSASSSATTAYGVGGSSSINAILRQLREIIGEHGDLTLCPQGSGSSAAEMAYVHEGRAIVTDNALAAQMTMHAAARQREIQSQQAIADRWFDRIEAGGPDQDGLYHDGWDEARAIVNSLPDKPFDEWSERERQAVEDRHNIAFSDSSYTGTDDEGSDDQAGGGSGSGTER